MAETAQFLEGVSDPLLGQVERIFYQRKSRAEVIDRDLLGEPGWDILLYTYISHRKGLACDIGNLAAEIDLSLHTTSRWVDILVQRKLLIRQDDFVALSDEAEAKLSKMFTEQLWEMRQAIALAASRAGQQSSN